MLYFYNPGELDIRLTATFGISAKDDPDNAIGRFGTGLKYAIAGVLRLGGHIDITSGNRRYSFAATEQTFRDKAYAIVQRIDASGAITDLGYSTDLGKHWAPWQLYRELYSNAIDENGGVTTDDALVADTIIAVDCPSLDEVAKQHALYFPDFGSMTQIIDTPDVTVYAGKSSALYNQGILINQLNEPALYTYNFKHANLTEDRTLADTWQCKAQIAKAFLAHGSLVDIRRLLATQDVFESELDWDWSYAPVTPVFAEAARIASRTSTLSRSAKIAAQRADASFGAPTELVPNAAQYKVLLRACTVLSKEFDDFKLGPQAVKLSPDLGEGVLAKVRSGQIWLSALAFENGYECVLATLFEEWLHAHYGYDDCSRSMQDYLLRKLVARLRKRS